MKDHEEQYNKWRREMLEARDLVLNSPIEVGFSGAWLLQQNKIDCLIKHLNNLIEDIETPSRLGLSDPVNPNWTSFKNAKQYLNQLKGINK